MDRREFLSLATTGIAAAWSPLLRKVSSVKASNDTRSIKDVKHIVILMQENRSFDHYFGTMKGVRGYGDRFPIPLESGHRVFHQSNGKQVIPPYRADRKTSDVAFIKGTPHGYPDTQAAWNQGKYGFWPKYKTPYSMAYYTREEIPFHYALAELFTICDAYHCSVTDGTDPNRIFFFSGSNFDPEKRSAGINCTDEHSEPDNLRCWIKGRMPEPGYSYQGNAFTWPTIPDVLEKEGISWRIYQDPNNNWTGAMHGCLAFKSFREAKPGSSIYKNGMRHWTLQDLENDVLNGTLPQVSWVLPSKEQSEHPGRDESPYHGGNFIHDTLKAITANPEVWSKTAFFLMYDENDGLFDHLPAPSVPSYNRDGSLAGKSTIDLKGMYFDNAGSKHNHLDKRDTITGKLRPWALGPRVPMFIISPWSKGGWVHSEVADHSSVGQFIEKRFGIRIPAISPWHRAVCSDLTSAFEFVNPNDPKFPKLPETSDYLVKEETSRKLPKPVPPKTPLPLYQEKGVKYSRALPYRLLCHLRKLKNGNRIGLLFENSGAAGAVYHVYDLYNLKSIPKRYTVEAGKSIEDEWPLTDNGKYSLEVYGPNGFFWKYVGSIEKNEPIVRLQYDHEKGGVTLKMKNTGNSILHLEIIPNAYAYNREKLFTISPGESKNKYYDLAKSGNWYDFSIKTTGGFLSRFAGRVETGKQGISDPAMATVL